MIVTRDRATVTRASVALPRWSEVQPRLSLQSFFFFLSRRRIQSESIVVVDGKHKISNNALPLIADKRKRNGLQNVGGST